MTGAEREALAAMKVMAEKDLLRIASPHATDVMEIWNMNRVDLRFGILDALSCALQDNGRHNVRTVIDGRAWTLIIEFQPEFVVVTLFTDEEDR